MKKHVGLAILTVSLMLGAGSGIFLNEKSQVLSAEATTTRGYINGDKATYYNGVDSSKSGDAFLSELHELNKGKRKTTVGYSAMGTSASGCYKYTDYDPKTVKYETDGTPYGTSILSFYSGKSTTSFNREHVWPESRGGGSVDGDIFMTRPTIAAENSDRGNSSYVEGMNHSKDGWDPVTAFEEDLGVYPNIRGECARIIFYCAIANTNLKVVEGPNISYNNSIGNLLDLLKWNLVYDVNDREKNRNEGGEYLQGNRNPFVDHPEYACKIWGNKSAATKQICSQYELKTLSSLTFSGSPNKKLYREGENFDPNGVTVTATYSNGSTENVTASVSWSPKPLTKGTTSVTGTYSYGDVTKQIIITGLTVVDASTPISVTGISLDKTTLTIKSGKTATLNATVYPTNATNQEVTWSSTNNVVATVNNGVVQGVSEGTCVVSATTKEGGYIANCVVNVTSSGHSGETFLVENLSELSDGDEVYIATGLEADSIGLTGWNNNKDATSSTFKENWTPYTVEISSGNYYLKDGEVYIAKVTDNSFKYDNVGGAISLDDKNQVKVGDRWICINGSNIRCYKTVASTYKTFHLYGVGSETIPKVNSISLDKTNITLSMEGEKTATLTPTVSAETGANTTVNWSTTNSSVVTINKNSGTKEESITLTANNAGNAIISATCGNKIATCNVTVTASEIIIPSTKVMTELVIKSYPEKMVYDVGETFDDTGLELLVNYLDGTSKNVKSYTIQGIDKTKAGTQKAEVIYSEENKSIKATFNVLYLEQNISVTKIHLVKSFVKTEYYVGDSLLLLGLQVNGTLSNGNVIDVTNLLKFTYNFSTVGTKVVKISLGDVERINIPVKVKSGEPTSTEEAMEFVYNFEGKLPEEIEDVTSDQWLMLEHYYNSLDKEAQAVLKSVKTEYSSGVFAGNEDMLLDVIEQYDKVIIAKNSQEFKDFIGRNPVNTSKSDEKKSLNIKIIIILSVVVLVIVALAIAIPVIIKTTIKKQK